MLSRHHPRRQRYRTALEALHDTQQGSLTDRALQPYHEEQQDLQRERLRLYEAQRRSEEPVSNRLYIDTADKACTTREPSEGQSR